MSGAKTPSHSYQCQRERKRKPRVATACRQASEAGSNSHPKGKSIAASGGTGDGFAIFESRSAQARIAQKEIAKLAMMAWMVNATARSKLASQNFLSITAAMAATMAAVARVRG